MKVANVSTTKNSLSSILAEVKQGESYLIVDRKVPVARLEPLTTADSRLEGLAAEVVVRLPETSLDVDQFLEETRPALGQEASAVEAIAADREDRV